MLSDCDEIHHKCLGYFHRLQKTEIPRITYSVSKKERGFYSFILFHTTSKGKVQGKAEPDKTDRPKYIMIIGGFNIEKLHLIFDFMLIRKDIFICMLLFLNTTFKRGGGRVKQ